MIDAQVKDMMKGLRNVLENCDKGIEANQKNCAEKVQQAEENLALAKSEYESLLDDKSAFIMELETSNADLSDKNSALLKENEALNSLKDAHEKNSEAWDKEREGMSNSSGLSDPKILDCIEHLRYTFCIPVKWCKIVQAIRP